MKKTAEVPILSDSKLVKITEKVFEVEFLSEIRPWLSLRNTIVIAFELLRNEYVFASFRFSFVIASNK